MEDGRSPSFTSNAQTTYLRCLYAIPTLNDLTIDLLGYTTPLAPGNTGSTFLPDIDTNVILHTQLLCETFLVVILKHLSSLELQYGVVYYKNRLHQFHTS
ncbi:hypothetical protein J6590_067704 [Homalodisca vitripennis]|nr:hypothetical protein J6590_067704 [Homalodisca vitripennis]